MRRHMNGPEALSDRYIAALWVSDGVGEHADDRGRYAPYHKAAGTVTIVAPGIVPAVRPRNDSTFCLCALEPDFLRGIEEEIGSKYAATPRYRTGVQDDSLRQLLQLLRAEIEQGGVLGQLYVDHLAHATALRLCSLDATRKFSLQQRYRLPNRVLQRVLDRMRDLNARLDLQKLAAETGYSRSHFLRMFQASTGVATWRSSQTQPYT